MIFIVFVFFALTLAKVFFPPDVPEWLRLLQSIAIYPTGYRARPLGGVAMAHFADRNGRKRIFGLTIVLMALPCLAMGISPPTRMWAISRRLCCWCCESVKAPLSAARYRALVHSSPSMPAVGIEAMHRAFSKLG
jgi:MFS family permease